MERIWKEAILHNRSVILELSGRDEENHEEPKSEQLMSTPRSEPSPSKKGRKGFNATPELFGSTRCHN